jgi:hypothetical protein
MCSDCEWDNFKILVDLGQLDNPEEAATEHFQINYKTSNEHLDSDLIEDESLTA